MNRFSLLNLHDFSGLTCIMATWITMSFLFRIIRLCYTTTFFVCEHLLYLSVKTSLCISAVQSSLTYKFHYSGHWNSCIILAFNVFSPSLCFSFQSTIYLSSKNFLDVWKFIHKRHISYITTQINLLLFISFVEKT